MSQPPPTDGAESARAAGLHYVLDTGPGIKRRRTAAGFRYLNVSGAPLRDPSALARIKSLAIPPAWTDVWICPDSAGHLQATGRDARGRKQYRYHPDWRAARDSAKYDRLADFADALPRIREATDRDLGRSGLPREKILAAVVQLLEETHIRIGNEAYRKQNHSFGLTTFRSRHVHLDGPKLRFQFRGKGGKQHRVALANRRLVRIVRRCLDIPGQELFQYLDEDGLPRRVESADVNAYLREVSGGDFTAKDFRTWAGSLLTLRILRARPRPESPEEIRREVAAVIACVAQELGNTPAVCRKCYIHPVVVEAFCDGRLSDEAPELREPADLQTPSFALTAEERSLLDLIRAQVPPPARCEAASPPTPRAHRAA